MRSLMLSGLVSISLALAGNTALAANIHTVPVKTAPAAHPRVAVRYGHPVPRFAVGQPYEIGGPYDPGPPHENAPYGFGRPQVDPAQIISRVLASPLVAPYVAQYAGKAVHVTRGSSGGTDQFDYSTPEPSPPPDTSIQDMLNRQMQQQADDEVNAINQMNATIAADAAQAAADNAAMTQQIMNNGGL